MAAAEARTTRLSSSFISATVCLTVDSNVASSMTSIPWLAWPRTTRPMRPKMSLRNGIISPFIIAGCLAFLLEVAEQAARAQHVHQEKMHAGEDVVLIFRSHIEQLAEVVQGNGRRALSRIVQLEIGR